MPLSMMKIPYCDGMICRYLCEDTILCWADMPLSVVKIYCGGLICHYLW
jgi:hypothetical protein